MQAILIQNVSNHSIYFFMLDCIAHSFILEVYGTRARLFQSHVISCPVVGYTAREWASSTPVADEPRLAAQPYFLQARDKWGAGRELPYHVFRELVDLIFNLQDYAETLAAFLFQSCLPKKLQAEEKKWWDAATASVAAGQPDMIGRSPPLLAWTNRIIHHPAYPANISMVSHAQDDPLDFSAGVQVFNNGMYSDAVDFVFDIPEPIHRPFAVAYRELTGCYPSTYVYIILLNMLNWKRNRVPDNRIPGGRQVKGWSFFAATVPAPNKMPRLVA